MSRNRFPTDTGCVCTRRNREEGHLCAQEWGSEGEDKRAGRDEKGGGERKRDILSISERVCGPSSRSEGECSGVDASASAVNISVDL